MNPALRPLSVPTDPGERPSPTSWSARFLRFGIVGASGVSVNLGVLYLLADVVGVDHRAGSAVAIAVSVLTNFFLNSIWTFRDRNSRAEAQLFVRMWRYILVSLLGGGLQWLTYLAVTSAVATILGLAEIGAWKYMGQLCGISVATFWNFTSHLRWTWAQRESANPVGAGRFE